MEIKKLYISDKTNALNLPVQNIVAARVSRFEESKEWFLLIECVFEFTHIPYTLTYDKKHKALNNLKFIKEVLKND